jgi:MFS family permease
LKAQERGFTTSEVLLLYLAFNVAASAFAFPSGKLSDRCGRSAALIPGYILYGLVYVGFALLPFQPAVIALFIRRLNASKFLPTDRTET